jgi:Nitrous oxide-stimulated promoter
MSATPSTSLVTAVAGRGVMPVNIERDRRTVRAMLHLYCHGVHGVPRGAFCPACEALAAYADFRLSKCPFGEAKTTCRECPIHCYRPVERAAMKQVMHYAGPRMLLWHPWLAVRHLWLERKGAPLHKGKGKVEARG